MSVARAAVFCPALIAAAKLPALTPAGEKVFGVVWGIIVDAYALACSAISLAITFSSAPHFEIFASQASSGSLMAGGRVGVGGRGMPGRPTPGMGGIVGITI
jgi:hypothetical protein